MDPLKRKSQVTETKVAWFFYLFKPRDKMVKNVVANMTVSGKNYRPLGFRLSLLILTVFCLFSLPSFAYGDSLVGRWHMNEGSGTTVFDSGPNQNDGTISGAEWVEDGISNSALSFDGADAFVEVPNSDSFVLSEGIAVSGWVKFNQTTSQKASSQYILKKDLAFKLGTEHQSFPNDEFKLVRAGHDATPATDTANARYGSNSAKFTRTTKGNSSLMSRYIDLSGVSSITLHGYNKAENVVQGTYAWEKLAWFGRWYDENKNQMSGYPDLGIWQGTFDWTLREATLTVPAGAKYYRILVLGLEQCTGTGWWDDVRITDQDGNLLFYASFEDDEVWFKVYNSDSDIGWVGVPTTQTTDLFTHYLGQYDREFLYIYQNGTEKARLRCNSLLNNSTANLLIGEGTDGVIDEISIYSRSLSSEEAWYEYKPAALIFHLDENIDTTVFDSSPNGNDGTIYGAVWTNGMCNSALSFDGAYAFVEVPNSDNFVLNEEVALSAWVKFNQTTSQKASSQYIFRKNFAFKLGAEHQSFPNDEFKWVKPGENATPAADTANAKYGSNSAKFTRTTNGNSSLVSRYIDLSGVSSITLHGYSKAENVVKGTNAWERLAWFGRWYDENKNQMSGYPDLGHWEGTFDWTLRERTLTVPAGAKYYRIVALGLEQCTGTGWWDDVRITDQDGNLLFYASFEDDEVWFKVYNSDSDIGWVGVPTTQTTDLFTHYLGQYDRKFIYIYQNGIEKARLRCNSPLNFLSSNLIIGGGTDGVIDEINIYRRSLSTKEIEYEYKPTALLLHLNEGVDTTVFDSSPNGNDGVIHGAVWTNGISASSALYFDGGDDYAETPNSSSLQLDEDLTISFWIKPANIGSNRLNPLDKSYGGEFALTIEPNGQLSYYHGTQRAESYYWAWPAFDAGSLNNGTWQHIAITREAQTRVIKSYLNGQLKKNTIYSAESNRLPSKSNYPLRLAKGYTEVCYGGIIDEVKIYKRALTAEEVTNEYNQVDITPPEIEITSHVAGQIVNTSPIDVSGTIDDNDAAVVVNGITATVSDGIFIAEGISLTQGDNTIIATAADVAGNSSFHSITVAYDNVAPSGTISVNNAALYTNSQDVILTLSATDSLSGLDEMQFSNDGTNWSTPEAYATSKTWTLTGGDGTKTVYVKFKDAVGNWSIAVSDTIILDKTPPSGTIFVNDDTPYTNSQDVVLTLSATDSLSGLDEMQFSNDGTNWSTPEAYAVSKTWTLTDGDGTKTVYVKFKDIVGNWSTAVSDTIILDTTAPVINITSPVDGYISGVPSLTVSGTIDDNEAAVIVNGITATVSDGTFSAEGISLTQGDNTIIATATDVAGNSSFHSITVAYDNVAPSGTISIDSAALYTNSQDVVLTLSATDNLAGLDEMQFSNDDTNWSTPEAYAISKTWTLTGSDGTKTVYVKFKDIVGNWSTAISDTIILDTTAPAINITSPADGYISGVPSLTVSGSIDDNDAAVVVNGITATVSDGTFSAEGISLTQGDNTITATATDVAGNSSFHSITVAYDNVAPSGTISIDNAALYTNSQDVILTLSATDNLSGLDEMQFSNDGTNWSTPEAYATSKTWALTGGDGTKTVYVEFKDIVGNWSTAVSDTIILDTTAPVIDITSPVEGAMFTTTPISVSGSVDDNDAAVTVNAEVATVSSGQFSVDNISLTLGNNTVTAIATDLTGNSSSDSIIVIYDNTPPAIPAVTDDGEYTSSLSELHASWTSQDTETGISEYLYSIGTSVAAVDVVDWTSAGTSTEVTHTGLSLSKDYIYYFNVKVWNNAGLWSDVGSSDGISVEQTIPEIIDITPSHQSVFEKGYAVPISVTAEDNDGDILEYQFEINDVIKQPWSVSPFYIWQTTDEELGEHVIVCKVRDNCGGIDSSTISYYLQIAPVILEDFDGVNDRVANWWNSDGETVYQRSMDNSIYHDGSYSMKVVYDKVENYPFSYFALHPKEDGVSNDFSQYNQFVFWVYTEDSQLSVKLILDDYSDAWWEGDFSSITQGQWTRFVYDFSDANIDLTNVRNVIFFIAHGEVGIQGIFYMDGLSLISTEVELPQSTPQSPQIISPEDGIQVYDEYSVVWTDEQSTGATVYELWEDDNDTFIHPRKYWSNNTPRDFTDKIYPSLSYYYKVRAWTNLPENYGTSSDWSNIISVKIMDIPPEISQVTSRVGGDSDNEYPLGAYVEIYLKEADNALDIASGTVRVASASLGYDSGLLEVTQSEDGLSYFCHWDTNGLSPSDDYVVSATLTDMQGQTDTDGSDQDPDLTISLTFETPASYGSTSSQDFFIPARGIPLIFNRYYSNDLACDTPIGYNWAHNYYMRVAEGVDGSVQLWDEKNIWNFFTKNPDGSYNSPPKNEHLHLTKNADGTFSLKDEDNIIYNFNLNCKLANIRDLNGNQVTLTYNEDDLLAEVTSASGEKLIFAYNDDGKIISVTDFPGNRINTYEYDSNNNLIKHTGPLGYETNYNYQDHLLISNGGHKYFTYDEQGRLESFSNEDGNNMVVYAYNDSENKITVTDARGEATLFTFNNPNNVTVKDPQNNSINFSWDAKFNVTQIIDQNNKVINFEYDSNNELISVSRQLNGEAVTNSFSHDPQFYKITSITDPKGNMTTFGYDEKANLVSITDAENNSITCGYDTYGNLTNITDSKGKSIDLTYYSNGLVETITDRADNTSSINYDACGNISEFTNSVGQTTSYTHDALNRLTQIEDAQDNTFEFTYDEFNNLKTLTDANGQVTTYDYDAVCRLVKITYPDNSTETYTYDNMSNVISKTNRKGQTINYTYDGLNRLSTKTYPDASSVTYGYDATGKLSSATDSNGTSTYVYDDLSRLTQVTYPGNKTIAYSYDEANNCTQMLDSDGNILNYVYDNLNRLTHIKDNLNNIIANYTYDENSMLTRKDFLNGTYSVYTYDDANRLLELVNKFSTGQIISEFIYSYDAMGNKLSMTTLAGTHSYVYDSLSQLTQVTNPQSQITSYNYDLAGNRTQVVKSGLATSYTTNNLNQYTTVGDITYYYDLNGNMTEKITLEGVTYYAYDYEDRLIEVITPEDSITYTYDYQGRRIGKTTSAGTTSYIYDNDNVILETDEAGVTTARYIHGTMIDEPICLIKDGHSYYYHSDGLGSITEITDEAGDIVEKYTYDIFGEVLITDAQDNTLSESSVGNTYFFTGRRFDFEANLYYYRTRYYCPEIGRFIQPDTIGYRSGPNLYTYCHNDPLNFIDPYGTCDWDWWWKMWEGVDVWLEKEWEDLEKEIDNTPPPKPIEIDWSVADWIGKEILGIPDKLPPDALGSLGPLGLVSTFVDKAIDWIDEHKD